MIKKVPIHFEVLFEPQVTESRFEIGRVNHPLAFICLRIDNKKNEKTGGPVYRIGVRLKFQNCQHRVKYDVIGGGESDAVVPSPALSDAGRDFGSVVVAEDGIDSRRRRGRILRQRGQKFDDHFS